MTRWNDDRFTDLSTQASLPVACGNVIGLEAVGFDKKGGDRKMHRLRDFIRYGWVATGSDGLTTLSDGFPTLSDAHPTSRTEHSR